MIADVGTKLTEEGGAVENDFDTTCREGTFIVRVDYTFHTMTMKGATMKVTLGIRSSRPVSSPMPVQPTLPTSFMTSVFFHGSTCRVARPIWQ